MRLGLALPHYDTSFQGQPASWEAVCSVATAAESAGFDSVWVSDHLFLDWGKYGGSLEARGSLECWTTMSALAAVTQRVRIGSLTLCNDLRGPALVAKMAATLDLLSGGRLELGVGAGWYEPEYHAAGIEFSAPGVRIARAGEAVEIITRLLAGEELDFSGRHYSIKGAICRPRPAQSPRPAVWMGGKGDYLLSTAARVADGWNFSWLGDFETYRQRSAAADRACEKRGRDPASLRRSVGAYVLAGSNEGDLQRRFERLAERSPSGVLRSSKGGPGVSFDEFRHAGVVGTAGEVSERLLQLVDLGVEEVIVSLGALPFQVADVEDVEIVGSEVGGALR